MNDVIEDIKKYLTNHPKLEPIEEVALQDILMKAALEIIHLRSELK